MKDDARSLNSQSQEQLRRQAIRLRKRGISNNEAAQIVGVHYNTVSKWWGAYQSGGMTAIMGKPRGKPKGTNRTLSEEDEQHIQRLLIDKSPDQVKLPFALWTREAVQRLIHQELGIQMPVRTIGDYLKRWGFTPQKPLKRAYEQQPKAVKHWLEETYPEIEARAKQEGAEIHWADETGVRSDCQHGRGYSPKGKTPVITLNAKRHSLNMISSVTNQGKVRFMLYHHTMDAKTLIQFFKRLIKDAERKCFVIVDNLRVHHAKIVKAWLAEQVEKIEVFYLPAYSPELNPDEYLNGDLKAGVHSKPPARNADQLTRKVRSQMMTIQRSPDRVKAYFRHPKIAYAA